MAIVRRTDKNGKTVKWYPVADARIDRPFEEETCQLILERLSNGRTVSEILETGKEEGLPSRYTFYEWEEWCQKEKNENPLAARFALEFARARKLQAGALFDQCLPIADDGKGDVISRLDKFGRDQDSPNPVAVARAKLKIDTRLRMAEILDPERFSISKRLDITTDGQSINQQPSRNALDAAKERIIQTLTGDDRVSAIIDLARITVNGKDKAEKQI